MVVADTSFLIDILQGDERATARLREYGARSEAVWIPAPALEELYFGAVLARHPAAETARVDELARPMVCLPLDAASARIAGFLRAERERGGRRPQSRDAEIAAIAMKHQEAVVTADKRFPRPRGLQIDTY
ncbi:MAG: PIN domain-containing protein [Euryarchaeota archaeon]|nr:PIN domain-containing protein [Euryarchaeota archaeon]